MISKLLNHAAVLTSVATSLCCLLDFMILALSQVNGVNVWLFQFHKRACKQPYRGVALTSVVTTVNTHILDRRSTTWTEQEE